MTSHSTIQRVFRTRSVRTKSWPLRADVLISCLTLALSVTLPSISVAAQHDAEEKAVFQTTFDIGDPPSPFQPLDYRSAQWYGSTFWSGPDWTRVGKDWQHPGTNTASVRKFVAPKDGHVNVTGRVFKRHLDGDGVVATIRINQREVWRTVLDGKDGTGSTHRIPLDVKQGDAIRFTVYKRGQIYCDTTGWDPQVTYQDGSQFVASAAFAAHEQGRGGWSYELEFIPTDDSGRASQLPRVLSFSPAGIPIVAPIEQGVSFELTQHDAIAAFVITTPNDDRGLSIAGPGGQPFRLRVRWDDDSRLKISLTYDAEQAGKRDIADRKPVECRPYSGSIIKGWKICDAYFSTDAFSIANYIGRPMPLSLWAMVQQDWQRQDGIDDSPQSYLTAANEQLEQTRRLLADLRSIDAAPFPPSFDQHLSTHARRLREIEQRGESESAARLWLAIHALKRRIALANPLLTDTPLVVCQRKPPSYSHLVGQYFGWRQRPGGGLFVLERPGESLALKNLLKDQLPPGNVLEPRLSYDGKRILFSFVACPERPPDPDSLTVNEEGPDRWYFHLYEINTDGSNLKQLTFGPYDDLMGEYLPDGDIVFCSTRRQGYSRCFGPQFSRRWHSYTLHRMRADGSGIRRLSHNDVNEWFPTVSNDGRVLFARWDYIDRDAVTHQNLWSSRPDGTDPVAEWGNALAQPHCTFQARPIPGSRKLAFIASAHHAITAGPLCLLDPALGANLPEAVTRITPLPFPEAESRAIPEYYESPWPLSEKYFLIAYSPYPLRFEWQHNQGDRNPDNALGIYLIDIHGNRELIFRDPDISTTSPLPLRPRRQPPILPSNIAQDRPSAGSLAKTSDLGEMIVADVYDGLGDVPRGTIKSIRIVQLFPKTTHLANQPRIGVAGEENARAILGTVPVEDDGSARFLLPAGKPVLLQLLDQDGMAYQTMRSSTYVQPGERVSCVGCHAGSKPAPRTLAKLKALERPPSRITPGELGGRPFSFVKVVQPVLDRHCIRCHGDSQTEAGIDLTGKPHHEYSRAYWSLCIGPIDLDPQATPSKFTLSKEPLVPRFPQRNQIQTTLPGGQYGARGSRLIRILRDGHAGVRLPAVDLKRLAAWIDLNAIFYGVYKPAQQERQRRGEHVELPNIQ